MLAQFHNDGDFHSAFAENQSDPRKKRVEVLDEVDVRWWR